MSVQIRGSVSPVLLNPLKPAQAFDDFLTAAAPISATQSEWTAHDGSMPALFLGHGAPPLFDDPLWISELFAWSQSMPKPRAILVVSAHWESSPMLLSATSPNTDVVYDFGGFADRYYKMRYDTPDASGLARSVVASLSEIGPVHQHASRGLDHGAWIPLKIMYPGADIPVLQLSLPTSDPVKLLALGSRLKALRGEGVLILGSGFMTHGVGLATPETITGKAVSSWSTEFSTWALEALAAGDIDRLIKYREDAPGMPYAHRTAEHFVPLFVTLGAGDKVDQGIQPVIDGYWGGQSRASFQTQ
ncbi:MAG: class III extradiol ring-cleavage dioxygenase [Candidatus Nanopelagicales bacterium]|nr:class III extradiol ring-cleavage dioxygenase [Candidatus Nanopelagicales bacterium]